MMKNPVLKVVLMFILVAAVSCRKGGTSQGKIVPSDTTLILGRWTWVRSNFLFHNLTPQSGVQKMLSFTAAGVVRITHNDSTSQFQGVYVGIPPVLLSAAVTDTLSYHFGAEPVGCPDLADMAATFTALVIKNNISQFRISNDTLYLVAPPCLIQPDSVVYVRTSGSLNR